MAANNTDQQKYLSLEGLKTFWGKIKEHVTTENAKIKVSVGKNGEIVDVKVDDTGRILTINDATLKTRLDAIDGAAGTVAGLGKRLDTAEKEIDALQTTVTKLDGDVNTDGSVKKQVATALASANTYTDALETELRGGNDTDTLKSLRDSIDSMTGDSGSVATAINKAINALDVTDTAVAGEYVSSVSETDGKIAVTRAKLPTYSVTDNSDFVSVASAEENGNTVFTISTSNIAKADELTALTADVRKLDKPTTGRVSVLEKKVAALASATHFIGVKTDLPATAANGDVVIVGEKEYIYSKPEGSETGEWKELGDTSAEQARIGALETTVGAAAQGEGKPATGLVKKVEDLEKAVGGSTVVNSFGGQSGTITVDTAATDEGKVKFAMDGKKLTATVDIGATADQGSRADSAVQSGIAVNGKHTTVTVGKDENKALNIKVDVNTVTDYTTDSTAIPTAGSVMTKINAAITALTAKQTTGTDITKIVTGVTQENGKIDVTSVAFNAITDAEINALL